MVDSSFIPPAVVDTTINVVCLVLYIALVVRYPYVSDGTAASTATDKRRNASSNTSAHKKQQPLQSANAAAAASPTAAAAAAGAAAASAAVSSAKAVRAGGLSRPTAPTAAASAAVTEPGSTNTSAGSNRSAGAGEPAAGARAERTRLERRGRSTAPVKWWVRVCGILYSLAVLPCAVDRQYGLHAVPPAANDTLSPVYSALIFEMYALVVYYGLGALYRQIRVDLPRVSTVLLVAPFALLPAGFVGVGLQYLWDRVWPQSLWILTSVAVLLTLWAVFLFVVANLTKRLRAFIDAQHKQQQQHALAQTHAQSEAKYKRAASAAVAIGVAPLTPTAATPTAAGWVAPATANAVADTPKTPNSPAAAAAAGAGGGGAVDTAYLLSALRKLWIFWGVTSVCVLVACVFLLLMALDWISTPDAPATAWVNTHSYALDDALPNWAQTLGNMAFVYYTWEPLTAATTTTATATHNANATTTAAAAPARASLYVTPRNSTTLQSGAAPQQLVLTIDASAGAGGGTIVAAPPTPSGAATPLSGTTATAGSAGRVPLSGRASVTHPRAASVTPTGATAWSNPLLSPTQPRRVSAPMHPGPATAAAVLSA